jgi:hypothetical protein
MTYRLLFLGEGTSDQGIAIHIERMAVENGLDVQIPRYRH